ncbi:AIPR family protein [Nocardiopsis dassonvillei]|uniref:AIPR family protein n=1 Tax=Nocardiopsis dassonvillei TaxID=2014 RepID=UPI003672F8D4
MSVVQVRHVQKEIEARFHSLIDVTDRPQRERGDALLTRGLSALAIQSEHLCSDMVAAEKIFDGGNDRGLDAVAVELRPGQPHICLVQSKWQYEGKAKFRESDVDAMMYGLDKILNLEFGLFNERFQEHVPDLKQALGGGTPKIILVLALMRTEPLNDDVLRRLKEKIAEYNRVADMVDYKVFDLRDIHRAILGDAASPKINTRVQLECFGQEHQPQAMYGTMTVPDVAALYEEHRRGLFAKNIRGSLDVSDVNPRIRNTLLEEPQHFWYFSNGITVLCDSVKPVGSARPGNTGNFDITGASVVNGAQTVTAVHKAYSTNPETAGEGRVLVRLISLENCPPGFGDQVTINTNTQNPIEERDFKSLDEVQIRLRDDFALELRLSYVIKRGEPMPNPEHGCSITEAAEALAATHTNAEFAAQAKRELSALWQDGTYRELFGSEPNARRVWRCVQLLRAVRGELSTMRDGLLGRAAAAASYGDLLITHVVFRQLVTRSIEDSNADWDGQLARVAGLAKEALSWVLRAIDIEYSPTSQVIAAVRNTERIRRVARYAVSGMAGGKDTPALGPEYQVLDAEQRGRQVDAVRTLVNAKRVPDGAVLEFRPYSRPERQEMTEWLIEDPTRGLAVWRNAKSKQLRWQADGEWYSPSGLVRKMRRDASGKDQPVQGTLHWHVPGEGSLADLAAQARAEQGLDVGEENGEV